MKCYCGSGMKFSECCEPVIKGVQNALTPEILMRARYSAYATGNVSFVAETHDPESIDDFDLAGAEEWAGRAQWLGLRIVSATGEGETDTEGAVEFVACYSEDGRNLEHHERSRFIRKGSRWYFSKGQMVVDQVVREGDKVGRNDPCPCGSGKKYKKCCAS